MPAKNLARVLPAETYIHIYNSGPENHNIFNDKHDYETFVGYLNDSLGVPSNSESKKKSFTVKGKTYQGTPHLPKNYYEKVNLIAYSLGKNHFHLLLHQVTPGSTERFLRSLSTRYSIYFNKKYKKKGPVYQGPYKSVSVKGPLQLLHLSWYIHTNPKDAQHSSLPEFLGTRDTSWVKPNVILSFLEPSDDQARQARSYKKFLNRYRLGSSEKEILRGVTLERELHTLERRSPAEDLTSNASQSIPSITTRQPLRLPEFFALAAILAVFLTIGIRSVEIAQVNGEKSVMTQEAVLSATISATQDAVVLTSPMPIATDSAEAKPIDDTSSIEKSWLIVHIKDGSKSVNIREKPSASALKVGEAVEGDRFELLSSTSRWHAIKLADDTTAYIKANYAQIEQPNIQ